MAFSSAIFASSKRERSTVIALALFFCCERSSAQRTISPLGLCWICTAESVVFTPWPPLPDARQTLISMSSGLISMSTSCASGSTATVQVLVWMRPCASVAGHALDAMHAALVFEPLVNVRAADLENDFLEAAEVGRTGIECLDLPAARFGVTAIHPVKVGGEQRGFRAARAGADFDDGIARIRRVRRHEAELDLLRQSFFVRFEPGDFLFRHHGQLGFRRLAFQQRAVLFEIGERFQIIFAPRQQFLEPGVFAGQFLCALRVVESLWIAQRGFDFGKAFAEFFDVRS